MKKRFLFATLMAALFTTATFTACEEDDEDDDLITEQNSKISLAEVVAKANPDGTMDIEGTIKTNTKLKEFYLENVATKEKINLVEGDATKSKTEDGKEWDAKLKAEKVPVAIYKLVCNTRFSSKVDEQVGKEYSFVCGAGAASSEGSYVSLVNGTSYKVADVKALGDSVCVDLVCLADKTFQVPSAATNQYDCFGKTAIFDSAAKQVETAANGTVITSTNCIATFNVKPVEGSETEVTIYGVVINSKGTIKIDVSGVELK